MLLLVRHGETRANRERRYLGRADLELNQRGMAQAARLAETLPRPDLLVSSPLTRARQTAAAWETEISVDDRWIELDYGPFDLQPVGSGPTELLERWQRDPDFAPAGVETMTALSSRVRQACADLSELAETSVVIVVTHVSPIKAAICWALDVPVSAAQRTFVEDAAVCRLDITRGHPVLRWFNRFGHQPGEEGEEPAGRVMPGGKSGTAAAGAVG